MNTRITPTARFLFAVPFMIACIFYFRSAGETAEAMPLWMGSAGVVWVYISAVVFAFASTSILVLRQVKLACFMLAAVLLVTVGLVHLPNIGKEELEAASMAYLLKDVSLAGAALLFATAIGPRGGSRKL